MTAARIRDAVILSGADLELVAEALRVAQRVRARNGLGPSAALADLQRLLSPRGPQVTPEPPAAQHGDMSTTEAAELLGVTPRTVRRRARQLGGRLVAGVLVLDRLAVLEHLAGTES